MQHDAWFFIGIFVFIFLIWAATGGPGNPLAFSGPALSQPEELGGGRYLSLPRAPFKIGEGATVALPGSSTGGAANATPAPAGFFGIGFGAPSTYGASVRLSHYVSNASSTDPDTEYLELFVSSNAPGPVDITNWTIVSEASTRKIAVIPRGTAVPTSGVVNATENIVLNPGDRALIHSGVSPVGASFRENKCTGYFETTQDFAPPLPLACPSAPDELKARYGRPYLNDPVCVDYVSTVGRCRIPVSRPQKLSSACEDFLTKYLNYNGCVAAHKNDADFHGTVWHIYLGREKFPLWRTRHELIKLRDSEQKTVDAFTY